MDLPFCSVVIPTHKRERELSRALASIAEVDYPTFETIVVDNSSGDDCARRVAEKFGVRLAVEPRKGVNFARNRGAAEARGEIIAFLDDDAVAEPGWLRGLVAEFKDPLVMGVSGPCLPLGPAVYRGLYNPGSRRCTIDLSTPSWFELAAFECPARGANMALRARAFHSWPGFDPKLPRGQDAFATVQLVEAGHKFVYTPNAVVRHPLPRDLQELRTLHFKHLTERGLYVGFLLTRGYKRSVLKHLIGKVRGGRQRNSLDVSDPFPLKVSAAQEWFAGLKGILLFAHRSLAQALTRPGLGTSGDHRSPSS